VCYAHQLRSQLSVIMIHRSVKATIPRLYRIDEVISSLQTSPIGFLAAATIHRWMRRSYQICPVNLRAEDHLSSGPAPQCGFFKSPQGRCSHGSYVSDVVEFDLRNYECEWIGSARPENTRY
jgi:hypothetical protein